jgi:DNA-binding PucR family transcriptional regulator
MSESKMPSVDETVPTTTGSIDPGSALSEIEILRDRLRHMERTETAIRKLIGDLGAQADLPSAVGEALARASNKSQEAWRKFEEARHVARLMSDAHARASAECIQLRDLLSRQTESSSDRHDGRLDQLDRLTAPAGGAPGEGGGREGDEGDAGVLFEVLWCADEEAHHLTRVRGLDGAHARRRFLTWIASDPRHAHLRTIRAEFRRLGAGGA